MRLGDRHDVNAAIPLPAGFVMILANRALLAIAHQIELRGGDADLHQVVFGCLGAFFAERDIVLLGAPLIAMALDGQLVTREILQNVAQFGGIGLQGVKRVGTKGRLVVVEIRVLILASSSSMRARVAALGYRGGAATWAGRSAVATRAGGAGSRPRSGDRRAALSRRGRRGNCDLLLCASRSKQADGGDRDQNSFMGVIHIDYPLSAIKPLVGRERNTVRTGFLAGRVELHSSRKR